MRKIFLTLTVILYSAISVFAQEDRNKTYNIVLGHVKYTHSSETLTTGEAVHKIISAMATGKTSEQLPQYENDVKAGIIRGLSRARRYRFTDESLLPSDSVQEGNLTVDVTITNIHAKSNTRTSKDKNGKPQVTTTYNGTVEAMLTFKDIMTGQIVKNQSFNGRGITSFSYSTQDEAIRDAIRLLSGRITSWLNYQLPLHGNIIEGSAAKKNKQKEVYIDLGSREGAVADIHFSVYVTKIVAGKEARQQIGKLRIEAVEGEDISRCKVQSGGKEIKAAIDGGMELKVISMD